MSDRNCLSYWFPRLASAAAVPVPRTEIVRWPGDPWGLTCLVDGEIPDGWGPFLAELNVAAARVTDNAGGPVFLRTGQGSGKHDWSRCCYFDPAKGTLPSHVAALVEWSHMVDFLGLRHDVWCVRELLPTRPVGVLPRFGGMPLTKEVRAFVEGGRVVCGHGYWPLEAIRQGLPAEEAHRAAEFAAALECTPDDYLAWSAVARRVAAAFDGDGAWSVDLLATDRGWFVTDMADAGRSYHAEGCPAAERFRAA